MTRIFIGMETSGQLRRRFPGHVISCDLLPSEDNAPNHITGDVFATLDGLAAIGWVPDFAVFHPECTYHTGSAAWAFNEPDFDRYPGVGYHQRVKPGTLTGKARHAAREAAEADFERIRMMPFPKVIENPIGTISTRLGHKPSDIVQPYEFGDDASKATCLWFFDGYGHTAPFKLTRTTYYPPVLLCEECRFVSPYGNHKCRNCKSERLKPRWSNQTDGGYNKLPPGPNRWSARSRTYDGIADAIVSAVMERLR